MKQLLNILKNNEFLPVNNGENGKYLTKVDSEVNYLNRLKTAPDDWYYRNNNNVEYLFNSKGYRAREFNQIDWLNSIVVLGASDVMGVGLEEKHTIPAQIEKIACIPTINLGIRAASITRTLHNIVLLNELYPAPKAVVVLWTNCERSVYYYSDHIVNCGSWNMLDYNYGALWAQEKSNTQINALLSQKTSKQLWKNRACYYEGTFWEDTAILLGCQQFIETDKSRDLTHIGINSAQEAAKIIVKGLKL